MGKLGKQRTITLTGRPPVTIYEKDWPVIARASAEDYDNEYRQQAFRTWDWDVWVRRHEDGRAIVYAVFDFDSAWKGERCYVVRRGKLLEAGATSKDICDAIQDVCAEMAEADHDKAENAARWVELAAECIADMPAEELA